MTRAAIAFLWLASAVAPEPVEVARVRTYTEGPVFDHDGNLFFTHNEGIAKLTPKGKLSDWVKGTEPGYNGHKILPDGTHIVCASKKGAIWRLAPDGRFLSVATDSCEDKPLRAPNDITLDDHCGYYFSDPGGSREAPIGTLHYVDSSGKTHLCQGGMRVPNGLVLDFNRKVLYLAETVPNRVLRFRVISPGKLGPLEVFATLPGREGHDATPDGLAIDTTGNVYVAHLGTSHVLVLDPKGTLVQTLNGGNYDVSNLAFGGPDMSQLFITGSIAHRSTGEGRVYRLDLKGVRGRR
jgi:gluconolactonase